MGWSNNCNSPNEQTNKFTKDRETSFILHKVSFRKVIRVKVDSLLQVEKICPEKKAAMLS